MNIPGDTMSNLIPAGGALPVNLAPAMESARGYVEASRSSATRKAYAADWQVFCGWCQDQGLAPLPATPATVALFLAAEASRGRKPATVTRRCAAIRFAHKLQGFSTPTGEAAVTEVLAGIRRVHGAAPRRVAPATAERLVSMLAACGSDLRGLRDRALLIVGFGGALRRSELVAIRVEDVEVTADGIKVTLPRSKTDQEGAGQVVAILDGPRLRVKASIAAWKAAAGIEAGPLFRSIMKNESVQDRAITDRTVADIVKARAKAAGLDPAMFSGHSLRAGFLTSAASSGAGLFKMMEVSRHRSVETVRHYVRRAELFKDHAGAAFM